MNGVSTSTIIRTVVLILALVNNCLTMAGYSPLPIEDEQVVELLSLAFTVGASVWAWWKNNSFTKEAIAADDLMHNLKNGSANEYKEDAPEQSE